MWNTPAPSSYMNTQWTGTEQEGGGGDSQSQAKVRGSPGDGLVKDHCESKGMSHVVTLLITNTTCHLTTRRGFVCRWCVSAPDSSIRTSLLFRLSSTTWFFPLYLCSRTDVSQSGSGNMTEHVFMLLTCTTYTQYKMISINSKD